MESLLDDLRYKKEWEDVSVEDYEGYAPNMNRYHTHSYYEISLILRGNVTVLMGDTAGRGTESRLLLIRPHTPHFIIPEQGALYTRRNLLFAPDLLADCPPEWREPLGIFSKGGRMMPTDDDTCALFLSLTDAIREESDPLRRRLLLLYLISKLSEKKGAEDHRTDIPAFVNDALRYISGHFSEKITAAALAAEVGVGRTTLMTGLRRYTGMTLCEYLTRCRLRYAVTCLRDGMTEQETAELCGFGSTCYLIRVFRRRFGTTPMQYIDVFNKNGG